MPADGTHQITPRPIVIVGAGPAGIRVAQELHARDAGAEIIVYGAEPYAAYDRVRLSSALAGDTRWQTFLEAIRLPDDGRILLRYGHEIVAIDREQRQVIDAHGARQDYASLVLATGSNPHVPDIPGTRLPGVFTFRKLQDAERLQARRVRSRRTVVLGGGLLGLEAARGMARHATEVWVVEHADRLMPRQLDARGAERLREQIEAQGIRVVVGDGVREIRGVHAVQGIRLRSGTEIACDTIIIATGIVPNTALALHARLSLGRAIRVDDQLRTSDPHIHAVGECAEHRGVVYGLVAPGFEQAATAAAVICGGRAHYAGSLLATRLKVLRIPVFSVGDTGEAAAAGRHTELRHESAEGGSYRKLLLRDGRLVGAMAVGEWTDLPRMQEAVRAHRRLWPWQALRFRRSGSPWPPPAAPGVAGWPESALVCNCNGVTRGALGRAIRGGCTTRAALAQCTRASTVCGSCAPLLDELLGQQARRQPTPEWRWLLVTAVLAALGGIGLLQAIDVPYPAQWLVQAWHWDALWRDGRLKQLSGFSLIALVALSLLMSLRKRIARLQLGSYAFWRAGHAVLALGALLVLLAHTGGRLGNALNHWLMLAFIGSALAGAAIGSLSGLEHRLRAAGARRWRRRLTWLHILTFWPLPGLVAVHVLKTYYF